MKNEGETDAQFTARMREKYKDELERIEKEGFNTKQLEIDKGLSRLLGIKPLEFTKEQLTEQWIQIQLKKYEEEYIDV
jgi:hypothetical protein